MKQCLTLILLLPLTVDVLKTPGGLGIGDWNEMVSNKCIHKKINHYLLTLLLLNIVVEGTTEMCVQIVC
jgi:hypothetical protein